MPSTITATRTSKKMPNFDHQGHAVGQRDRRQEEAVLEREQPQDLGDGFAAVDHHEEADQEERDGHGQGVVAQGARPPDSPGR